MATTSSSIVWPPGRVPVELFIAIARRLPSRDDAKSMRLVCWEFNLKLLSYFFRQTVIRVGPNLNAKLYSAFRLSGDPASIDITDRMLNSDAFKIIGSEVRRLGFAFELDECDLATPYTEDLEEIHVRPWAKPRWPIHPGLSESHSPLGLFAAFLEKSQGMSRLLSETTNVRELALSCDGGLGYLQGPDVNPLQPLGRPPVFGKTVLVRHTEGIPSEVLYEKSYIVERLEKDLAAQGVAQAELPGAIELFLRTNETTIEKLTEQDRRRPPLPMARYPDQHVIRPFEYEENIRLQPDQLTGAQRRLLYQHNAAQQVLIRSFLLAVIDNSPSFTQLTKLNIARIPSFHISALCSDRFWSALPELEEVALGVIPDWRSITRNTIFESSVRQVYPTHAIPKVLGLLEGYIGRRPQIKRLHFEWLCGGELASGCVQRGDYVLPAPFLREHRKVINSEMNNLLILPHITHLSLKNCWFAPNVFYRIMHTMAKEGSLESLELETVSLSGPPIFRQWESDDDPGNDVDVEDTAAQEFDEEDSPPALRNPLDLSWCHIIDMLTPGMTIKESIHKERNPGKPPLRIRKDLKLRRLSFKSCGYILIDDDRFISERRFSDRPFPSLPNDPDGDIQDLFEDQREELSRFLQINTDRHLGTVAPFLAAWEEYSMEKVWGFTAGWEGVYDPSVEQAAMRDGVPAPGVGRFSGTIAVERHPPFFLEYEYGRRAPVVYEYDTSPYDGDYDDETGLHDLLHEMEVDAGY